MKDRERPCSIRPQLRSSQNVLQRSVEPAPESGHCAKQSGCLKGANCRHGTLIDHLVGARNHTTPRGSFEASNDLSRQKTQRRTTCIALFSCVLLSSAGTTSCKLECRVPFFPCKLCSYK